MLRTLCALPALLLTSCIISIDVPEDHEWHEEHVYANGLVKYTSGKAGVVSGRVVDASGSPAKAKIVAVFTSGSYSQWAEEDGTFALGAVPKGDFVLKAATEDGRIALLSGLERKRGKGLHDLELILEEGGLVNVSIAGQPTDDEPYRCAAFHDGDRISDFTLRPGERVPIAVPAGRVPLQLYRDDAVFAATEVLLDARQSSDVVFQVD